MNILFIVLKIIGILLCVILLLALLVLMHPIFYSIKGEAEGEVSLKGSVWWLFQILRLEFQYEEEFTYQIRIFGIRKGTSSKTEQEEWQEPKSESEPEERTDLQTDLDSMDVAFEDDIAVEEPLDYDRASSNADKKCMGKDVTDLFSVLKREISDDKNRMAVSHLWKELWYLLRHLKPNYIKADMSFATGDPASTGEVTGFISLIPMLYQYPVKIEPDFLSDVFYIRGKFALKGHMALFHFVCCVVRLFSDKNIKRFVYKLRK